MFIIIADRFPSGNNVIGPFKTRKGAEQWKVGKVGKFEIKPVLRLHMADSGEPQPKPKFRKIVIN